MQELSSFNDHIGSVAPASVDGAIVLHSKFLFAIEIRQYDNTLPQKSGFGRYLFLAAQQVRSLEVILSGFSVNEVSQLGVTVLPKRLDTRPGFLQIATETKIGQKGSDHSGDGL